ncbi:hypothetical protein C8J57DRAFT_1719362 [Mycena rebaudengoi]|nr:hypothetical protein C8J57DRAFT_1719362 [Mycena rebaudengoi]
MSRILKLVGDVSRIIEGLLKGYGEGAQDPTEAMLASAVASALPDIVGFIQAQLDKNNAEKKMRQALGNITNANAEDEDQNASSRASDKGKSSRAKRPKKRLRIVSPSPESSNDEASGDESGAASGESEDESAQRNYERTKKVESLGRRFVLCKGLWLVDDVLENKLDPKYDEKKRFDGEEAQGQLRDILDILPERCMVSACVSERSGTAIYNCSPADLLTPTARLKFKKEIGWKDFEDGEGGEYVSLDVPILHKGGSTEYDIHTCFLNPVLMRLYVATIRGSNAVVAMLAGDSSGATGRDRLAIWGKSADVCLQSRGDHTNIDYQALFDEYLDILMTGLRKKSPSILHVFSEWDRIVFPNADAGHTDPTKKKRRGKTDGYHRAMEAMEEEAEPSENGGDREGGGDSSPVDDNNPSGGEQGGNDMAGGDGSEG